MIDCNICGGTGITKGPLEVSCAACSGSGRIIAGTCPACDGNGVQDIITDVLCQSCNGSGVQPSV